MLVRILPLSRGINPPAQQTRTILPESVLLSETNSPSLHRVIQIITKSGYSRPNDCLSLSTDRQTFAYIKCLSVCSDHQCWTPGDHVTIRRQLPACVWLQISTVPSRLALARNLLSALHVMSVTAPG